jgi:hypothetical protein
LISVLFAIALAAEPSLDPAADQLLTELMAMPDHATRKALVMAKLSGGKTDAATTARLGQVLGVVAALDERGVTEPGQVRDELRVVLAGPDSRPAPSDAAAAPLAPGAPMPRAHICLGRPSVLGAAFNFPITVSGRSAGKIKAGGYLRADVAPGPVVLAVPGESNWSITLDTTPGQTYYVKVVPIMGALEVRGSLEPFAGSDDPKFVERCGGAPLVLELAPGQPDR